MKEGFYRDGNYLGQDITKVGNGPAEIHVHFQSKFESQMESMRDPHAVSVSRYKVGGITAYVAGSNLLSELRLSDVFRKKKGNNAENISVTILGTIV